MSTQSIVHVNWRNNGEASHAHLFAGTPSAIPYTFFTVYNKARFRRQKKATYYPLMFIGSHFQVTRDMPLLLEVDETGIQQRLFTHPYSKNPTLLWERPEEFPEWVGIFEGKIGAEDPSPFRVAPTIAISHWVGDDYYHIYITRSSGLTEKVIGLLHPHGACDRLPNSNTAKRGVYDVLYFGPEDYDACSPASILLEIPNSDFVFYWDW